MKRILPAPFLLALVLSFHHSAARAQSNPEVTAAELLKHVRYLASDQLEGRKAGSKGAELAAQYVANEFKRYSLKPLGDQGTYFQSFEFVAAIELGVLNTLSYTFRGRSTSTVVNRDFRPLGFSSSESFTGDLVFAGYGISAPGNNYNDYDGIDPQGKAVLVLRNAPPSDSTRNFTQFSSLRYKAAKARELGVKALVIVTGPADSDTDELLKLSYDQSTGNAGIPAVHVTRKVADELLRPTGKTISDLEKRIISTGTPQSTPVAGVTLSMTVELKEIRQSTKNIIGYLEGNDPLLKDQLVILGAHHDHLGFGGEGSGSLKPDTVAVHNGADDNASGTAGLLELAQAFAVSQGSLKRSMLFISFAGEEMGLLGSAHYVKNPTVPLERAIVMINMDMIGRLNHRALLIGGIGTSAGFEDLVNKHNADSAFVLKLTKDGFGPSDHSSFYGKQIPVFHFWTDLHPDYHRPSDDYDRINYEGMEQVARYIWKIASDLGEAPDKPQYVAVAAPRPMGRSTRVYMGTIPDFGGESEGMKISGVREGSPAAKAGLQGGDVIIKFGKVDVKNLYDFSYALGEYKPDDEVDIVVKRGTEIKTMRVKLEKRN